MICEYCNKEIPSGESKCPTQHHNKSDAWYLLPILFGVIGGIIMYFVIHDENHKMAKKGFYVGLFLTVSFFILTWIIL